MVSLWSSKFLADLAAGALFVFLIRQGEGDLIDVLIVIKESSFW